MITSLYNAISNIFSYIYSANNFHLSNEIQKKLLKKNKIIYLNGRKDEN
jgi:hypothetical protein